MATVVSIPAPAWVASLQALTGIQYSASLYFSVTVSTAWQAQVPVQMRFSLISTDAQVNVYASYGGTQLYDSIPTYGTTLKAVLGTTQQETLFLPTGQWLIQVLHTGAQSASVAILTQLMISAVANT